MNPNFQTYFLFYWSVLRNRDSVALSDDVFDSFYKSMYRHWKFSKRSHSSLFGATFLTFMAEHISPNDFESSLKIITDDLREFTLKGGTLSVCIF